MKGATVIDHDWRPDIQVLRGLAVSLVILEHAAAGLIPGGFLGVDIFFVISGFLMTKLILTDLDAGSFSFGAFYARRARRLLPAAYTTILVTLVAAPALIDPHELRDLAFQAVGAFTFTTNLVLWRQTDYFGSGAGLKPLLHLWSLSLEEQYFLLLPALLVFTPGRLRTAAIAGAVAVSVVLCLWFVQRSPSAAFYFLPFRAWELGFGSLAALSMRAGWHLPLNRTLVTAAAATLLLVPCLAGHGGHPGWPAFVVCTATVVILLTRGVPTYRALAPLGLVGDRSYSLYLVHWPVFAFANNIWLTPLPSTVAALLLVICLVAAEAQYRWVEIPFRRASVTRQMIAAFVAIPLATLGITLAWVKPASAPEIANRAANLGLGPQCAFGDIHVATPGCDSAESPTALVWGDSFAMHVVDGLVSVRVSGIRQATKVMCGPFLDMAPLDEGLYRRRWAEGCLAFNDSVVRHLRGTPELRTVILASAFSQYMPATGQKARSSLLRGPDRQIEEKTLELEALTLAIEQTAARIKTLGREVVIMGPPPAGAINTARCLARAATGLPSIGGAPDCRIEQDALIAAQRPVLALLDSLEKSGLKVVRPDRFLCGQHYCRVEVDGIALYQDASHLSSAGSRALARAMGWAGLEP